MAHSDKVTVSIGLKVVIGILTLMGIVWAVFQGAAVIQYKTVVELPVLRGSIAEVEKRTTIVEKDIIELKVIVPRVETQLQKVEVSQQEILKELRNR